MMLSDLHPHITPVPSNRTVPDTAEAVSQVEARFGDIPEPYRSLLLAHGPFGFDSFASVVGGEVDDLTVLMCWGAAGTHGIGQLYDYSPEVFGERWVPFADDEGGSTYAWQRDDHSIWFFDIERGMTPTRIFPSMQAFFDAIELDPYED